MIKNCMNIPEYTLTTERAAPILILFDICARRGKYIEKRNLGWDVTAGGIISHHSLQTTRASDHTGREREQSQWLSKLDGFVIVISHYDSCSLGQGMTVVCHFIYCHRTPPF
jgi:hypothetical protein